MDISMVVVTIYFVGIAAVANQAPQNNVNKAVIFPEASEGGDYMGTPLMPHLASLNLRTKDFVAGTPADFCSRIDGTLNIDNTICSVPLHGARLWTQTTEGLTEDTTFRQSPSFLNYNRNARNLPDWYTGVDPKFVAARFDIRGGKVFGCNRGQQFIAYLSTNGDGVLYLEQAERTVRIVLNTNSVVAIENKPLHSMTSATGESHFGWYYAMNGRFVAAIADPIARPTAVSAPTCAATMPIEMSSSALASAECSTVNFP